MFTPLITHDSDGTALAAPVDAARRNGATYKTRTIDDLRIKDDRLRAAIEGTGHLLFDGGMGTMLQAAGMKAGALPELLNFDEPQVITDIQRQYVEAGCDVITANTFGANAHKLDGAATVQMSLPPLSPAPARLVPATSPVTSAPSAHCFVP